MVVQVAILAGDFLLARASVTLAALRDSEVIQLLSQVIEDLVTGEILQVCLHNKGRSNVYIICLRSRRVALLYCRNITRLLKSGQVIHTTAFSSWSMQKSSGARGVKPQRRANEGSGASPMQSVVQLAAMLHSCKHMI